MHASASRHPLLRSAVAAIFFSASIAWSAGGGGSGGGSGSGGGPPPVQADADYQAAMAAVKSEDWKQVITRMEPFAQRNPGNADAWNELGHAYRRTGEMDKAFEYYDKALKIDPKHRGAREYLGEAYLQVGDLDRAEQQLKALDKICFLPCHEFTELREKIAAYKASAQAPAVSPR